MRSIDYGNDVIDYRLQFINPGERIIQIVAFDWIPVEYRDLRMLIEFKSHSVHEKKVIDFNLRDLNTERGESILETQLISDRRKGLAII